MHALKAKNLRALPRASFVDAAGAYSASTSTVTRAKKSHGNKVVFLAVVYEQLDEAKTRSTIDNISGRQGLSCANEWRGGKRSDLRRLKELDRSAEALNISRQAVIQTMLREALDRRYLAQRERKAS